MRPARAFIWLLCAMLVVVCAIEGVAQIVTPSSIQIFQGSPVCAPGSDTQEVCLQPMRMPIAFYRLVPRGNVAGLSLSITPERVEPPLPAMGACFQVAFTGTRSDLAGQLELVFSGVELTGAPAPDLARIPVDVDCSAVACSTAQRCDDGNPCTDDACANGRCIHTDNTAPCDDGNPCNGADICRAGTCVPLGAELPACDGSVVGAFVANYGAASLAVVDIDRGTVAPTPLAKGQWGVAASPDGSTIYVSNRIAGTVSVIDTRGKRLVGAPIAVGPRPKRDRPVGLAIDPRRSLLYVANLKSSTVSVIDVSTGTVVRRLEVGNGPADVALNADGSRLYVAHYRGDSLWVIETESYSTIAKVAVGRGPIGVVVDPSSERVYVTNYLGGRVTIVGTASNTAVDHVRVGSHPVGVALDAARARLFVTNSRSNSLSMIDTGIQQQTAKMSVGSFPFGLTVAPDGRVLVANARAGTVSIVDPATRVTTVLATGADRSSRPISLGSFLAVDPTRCPARPLQCDDGDPATVDTCSPTAGCQHASPLTGVEAARADVDALAAALNAAQPGTAPTALRAGTLVTDAQNALNATPADVPSARRALRELVGVLKRGVAGVQPRVASRLLDLTRAALGEL